MHERKWFEQNLCHPRPINYSIPKVDDIRLEVVLPLISAIELLCESVQVAPTITQCVIALNAACFKQVTVPKPPATGTPAVPSHSAWFFGPIGPSPAGPGAGLLPGPYFRCIAVAPAAPVVAMVAADPVQRYFVVPVVVLRPVIAVAGPPAVAVAALERYCPGFAGVVAAVVAFAALPSISFLPSAGFAWPRHRPGAGAGCFHTPEPPLCTSAV